MTDKEDSMPMLTHHALGFEQPKKKLDLDGYEEEAPEPEPEPVEVDTFIDEIAKIKHSQSPAVKDTIERAGCFGRNWYIENASTTDTDTDEGGICTEWECDLRSLCELVFTRATGKQIEQKKNEAPISFKSTQEIPEKSKGKRKWVGRVPKSKQGGYIRYPYVDRGRPSDQIAHEIWKLLGGPPSMPDMWQYPPSKTKEDRKTAPQQFRDRFGSGIVVSKRSNYHQYFKDGSHFLRFWVLAAGGGWMDVCGEISKTVMKVVPDLKLEHAPPGRPANFKFYPYRVFVSRQAHLNRLVKIFEYIGIVPMAEEQQENDSED